MSTDTWWTIRQALVEYRDKDFSSATNEQIHAMTDALAADLESQLAEQQQQPAPVSATEPLTCERCGIADADVRFDGDFAEHTSDGGCFFALVGERNTLRARVAELERVTEEQVERKRVEIMDRDAFITFEEATAQARAALTAACGGSV